LAATCFDGEIRKTLGRKIYVDDVVFLENMGRLMKIV
jgi:ribosome-associated protein YbcJ (S4-like RNA binding protein)